ncbi:MAG: HAD family hydrolase [bacterium]
MNIEKFLVAFDCDGVIFDHIGEDFLCAYNALLALFPETRVPGITARHLDLEDIAQVKHENILFAKFRSLARFALRAEDYYSVFEIALHGDNDLHSISEEDFQEAKQSHLHLHPRFKEEFYKARSILQEQAPQKWAEIVPIYPGVFEAISGLASRPGTVVAAATGRDRASTVRLLAYNRIDRIIQQIASRENGNTKLEQLTYLSELTGISLGRMIFVDDKLSNLFEVAEDCIPVLADWGLTSPQDIEKGKQAGLHVLRLPSLYQQVDSLLNRLGVPQHTETE